MIFSEDENVMESSSENDEEKSDGNYSRIPIFIYPK
jgi:hypothetical protein